MTNLLAVAKDPAQFTTIHGISFSDTTILDTAFTHRSYLNERGHENISHNERLEFLGDAVLELLVTEFLFGRFPDEPEGILTAYRAAMVNTDSLSYAAERLEMDHYLRMSKGERMDTEKGRGHILANTFEAFVGALFLDSGIARAKAFVEKELFPYIDTILAEGLHRDAKSYFQERAQEIEKTTPHYDLIREVGPDHDKQFVMGLYLGDSLVCEGSGPSKQKAETDAARKGLAIKGWN